jgi:uncharacterized protein (DUF58 family)
MTTRSGYRYLDPAALGRVKNLALLARGVVEGFISGLHSSPYKGFSVEFAEHRNYAPGDNIRHLDWRMLARTDRLYMKQYEEETNLRAQIVLDVSRSMMYRSGQALSKLHYSAYLTAVLACLMTRQQDAVGLTAFDECVRLDMPAHTSPRHFGEMMTQLETLVDQREAAGASAAGQVTHVAQTLHQLAERFKRRCLIVLISDLYDEPDAVARALHHFRHRRHDVIVFHVFDQAELEFTFRETARFVDLETGQQLQVDPGFVRDSYRAALREFVDGYRQSCSECRIDYVMTDTSVPYDLMLSRYLSKRSGL